MNLTPKQFLRRYIDADNEIKQKEDEISRLRTKSEKLITSYPDDGRTISRSKSDTVSLYAAEIVDIESDVQIRITELKTIKKEVEDVINAVEDSDERLVLNYRYINGLDWGQIDQKINHYEIRWIYKIHGCALASVKKILKVCSKMQ